MDRDELKAALRDVLSEEMGGPDVDMAGKWKGGELLIRSGRGTPREKAISLEAFFRKITMVRDRLRVIEQKVNSHPQLTMGEKVTLQQYVTKAYGTLTTFNFLFQDRDDGFAGERKEPSGPRETEGKAPGREAPLSPSQKLLLG